MTFLIKVYKEWITKRSSDLNDKFNWITFITFIIQIFTC